MKRWRWRKSKSKSKQKHTKLDDSTRRIQYIFTSFISFSNPSHKKMEQLSVYLESKLIERQVEDLKERVTETERELKVHNLYFYKLLLKQEFV